jgi:glycosyltransferase involved in cell wall biosynthesis
LRVGLNLLSALPEIGGAWNYIENLLQALAVLDRGDSFVAFVTPESECLVPERPNFERVRVGVQSSIRAWRVAYENTVLYTLARRQRLECLHWFSNTRAVLSSVPSVVTIYDLQPFLRLSPYSWAKRLYLKFMMTQTARRARVLLPMSDSTADGLTDILGVDRSRVAVIPPVLRGDFRPGEPVELSAFRERYDLPGRFWLYVAHLYPHKNHLRLLEAYRVLKAATPVWPLVLRGDPKGAEAEVRRRIRELDLEKDVRFLPRLEAADLRLLYSAATALVFPSLYEGGGMPVVEAMACGLPVAASRIPPVEEFAGPAAVYFNPLDVSSMAGAMRRMAEDPGLLETRRREGLTRAGGFRPEAVIPRLLEAYARAASSR